MSQSPDWMKLQAENPQPSLLDAIEFAKIAESLPPLHEFDPTLGGLVKPTPARRVRIICDQHAEDPRVGMDLMCEIMGDYNWRKFDREHHVIGLIRDTESWMVVERIIKAARSNPDRYWDEDDLPNLQDANVRQQWLDSLADCLLVREFDTQSYRYLAHTTPEMCAKVGVRWEDAARMLEAEVEMFKQWADGDVYGFVVEEWTDECACEQCSAGEWVEIDSCWGFYGSDPFENGMSEHIDEELHDALRRAEVEY